MNIAKKVFTEQETLSLLEQGREELRNYDNQGRNLCCYKDTAWRIELITGFTTTGIQIEDNKRLHVLGYLHKDNNFPAEIIIEGAYHPDISGIGRAFCERIIARKKNCEIGQKIKGASYENAKTVKTELECIARNYSNSLVN